MNTVAILGSKGGTGKTSLSHCLAYGAHLCGRQAVLVHTDNREPLKHQRPYQYVDGRDNYSQINELIRMRRADDGLLVIDGAGNRSHLDIWMTKAADLVLVPVTNSPEDVRCALSDLARIADSRVRVVINKWPSNRFVRLVMARYISVLPESRIAGRLNEVGAVRVFLEDAPWVTPVTKVNTLARRFYGLVDSLLAAQRAQSVPARTMEPPSSRVNSF